MRVDVWMTSKVHTVKPLDSIQHARELMTAQRVNQLPVVAGGHVVGIVTDRDLRDAFPSVFDASAPAGQRKRSLADPAIIPVEQVMTERVLTLGPHDSVVEAARLMRRERVGAVPVVDNGRLVGILARSDLLDAFVRMAESGGTLVDRKPPAR